MYKTHNFILKITVSITFEKVIKKKYMQGVKGNYRHLRVKAQIINCESTAQSFKINYYMTVLYIYMPYTYVYT